MESAPLVTVLIPIKNGAKYLLACLNSVINQTYSNLEILLINDHSSDNSISLINTIKDNRITVASIHEAGIVAALNYGLSISRGEYVARLDIDDIALPSRIEEQTIYLNNHKAVGVVGSWVRGFGTQRKVFQFPVSSNSIKCELLFNPPFAHPAVMFRKSSLTSKSITYTTKYPHVEDYAMWLKLAKYTEFYNIPKVLTLHRFHPHQVSTIHGSAQSRARKRLQRDILLDIGITQLDMVSHLRLNNSSLKLSSNQFTKLSSWVDIIIKANKNSQRYDNTAIQIALGRRYLAFVLRLKDTNIWYKLKLLNRMLVYIALSDIIKKKLKNLI